jgi:hypothetical protein
VKGPARDRAEAAYGLCVTATNWYRLADSLLPEPQEQTKEQHQKEVAAAKK